MRLVFETGKHGQVKDAGSPMIPAGRSSVWGQIGLFVRESFTGAWQRGEERSLDTALANPVLFRVVSLISGDIAKMCCRLVKQSAAGIWVEADNPAWSPVLRKPNHFQNRIQFFQSWVQSKLDAGNAYILLGRDARGVVNSMYVLDPMRVTPLVAADGSIYYQLRADNLSGVEDGAEAVPASEIIHDRWNTFFHPLVGLSPIYACGLAALGSQEIQRYATKFFRNGAMPGGVLTAPAHIEDETANRLKAHWESNYTGENAGRVAVLGDGLKYEQMTMTAVNAQMIEHLKWTGETICGAFGVPPYMAGVGQAPLNNNVESLAEQYYSQCIQIHVESIELCLDEGLGLPKPWGVEFDLDGLLRMDTGALMEALEKGKNTMKPNEARKRLNLPPVKGGDAVYRQQQDYSLEALAKRDAQDDPFGKAAPTPAPANDAAPQDDASIPADEAAQQAAAAALLTYRTLAATRKALAHA